MNYNQFSTRAKTDLAIVMGYLDATEQSDLTERVTRAIRSNAASTTTYVEAMLSSANWSDASAEIKQRVGMLSTYCRAAEARNHAPQPGAEEAAEIELEYGRDRQADAVSKANSKVGRVSLNDRISLPSDLENWWRRLGSEGRGDWIAKQRKIEQGE